MTNSEISEFAINDGESLHLGWARYSRLIEPQGPFRASWLFDQVVQKKVKSVMLTPRDKLRGVRVIELKSLIGLLEELVAAPSCSKAKAAYRKEAKE